jgi:16S rRNA (cytidine1402-2'-O)-methyltransferase
VRGEVTIVVAGAAPYAEVGSDPASLLAAVAELEAEGVRRKEAIVEVAQRAGVPKREVYNLVHGGGEKT